MRRCHLESIRRSTVDSYFVALRKKTLIVRLVRLGSFFVGFAYLQACRTSLPYNNTNTAIESVKVFERMLMKENRHGRFSYAYLLK